VRLPALLWLVAFGALAPWAMLQPAPYDWDPSYYLGVAQRLVAGEGATTDAVWNLAWLPPALVHPADLHWMPLASRWLVPFVALPGDDWRAAQLATAALGAAWAPLAWAWARRLGATPTLAVLAGLAAASGGGYARWLTSPETVALYGLLGGAALLASTPGAAALGGVLAALTRVDGGLLGLALALRPRPWPTRLLVLVAGPLAALAWAARGVSLAGPEVVALRRSALHGTDPAGWVLPAVPDPLPLADRLGFLLAHLGPLARAEVLATGFALAPFALFGAWRTRRMPGVAGVVAYALAAPVLLLLLAPAVAVEGSLFRSLAVAYPPACALAMVGAGARGPLVPAALVAVVGALSVAAGLAQTETRAPFPDCAALASAGVPAGAPLLSYDPLGTSTRCGHPGVALGRAAPEALDALAERYDVHWMLAAPVGYRSWTLAADEVALPGWERVAPRVWRRP